MGSKAITADETVRSHRIAPMTLVLARFAVIPFVNSHWMRLAGVRKLSRSQIALNPGGRRAIRTTTSGTSDVLRTLIDLRIVNPPFRGRRAIR